MERALIVTNLDYAQGQAVFIDDRGTVWWSGVYNNRFSIRDGVSSESGHDVVSRTQTVSSEGSNVFLAKLDCDLEAEALASLGSESTDGVDMSVHPSGGLAYLTHADSTATDVVITAVNDLLRVRFRITSIDGGLESPQIVSDDKGNAYLAVVFSGNLCVPVGQHRLNCMSRRPDVTELTGTRTIGMRTVQTTPAPLLPTSPVLVPPAATVTGMTEDQTLMLAADLIDLPHVSVDRMPFRSCPHRHEKRCDKSSFCIHELVSIYPRSTALLRLTPEGELSIVTVIQNGRLDAMALDPRGDQIALFGDRDANTLVLQIVEVPSGKLVASEKYEIGGVQDYDVAYDSCNGDLFLAIYTVGRGKIRDCCIEGCQASLIVVTHDDVIVEHIEPFPCLQEESCSCKGDPCQTCDRAVIAPVVLAAADGPVVLTVAPPLERFNLHRAVDMVVFDFRKGGRRTTIPHVSIPRGRPLYVTQKYVVVTGAVFGELNVNMHHRSSTLDVPIGANGSAFFLEWRRC